MKKSIALKISRQQIAHEEIRQACGCINKIDGGIKYCTTHAGLSDTDRRKLELWEPLLSMARGYRKFLLSKKLSTTITDVILDEAAKLEEK